MLSHASSQAQSPALIRVEDLWGGYPGRKVLRGISLSVRQGEFVGVLGPNGSGKTTLLLALSGLLPLEKGEVEIAGAPLRSLKPRERARLMAAVAQDGAIRFPYSCEDVVKMGRYPHQKRWSAESPEDLEKIRRAMDRMDCRELGHRPVTSISGGERQRVLMARALAQDTPLLLLDEAVSAMDVHRKLQAFQVLEDLNRHEGLTVLAVLHDVNLAALFCRRLLVLREGRVVADGSPETVMRPEVLEGAYRSRAVVQNVPGTGKLQVTFLPS